jgi:hypothetical protein
VRRARVGILDGLRPAILLLVAGLAAGACGSPAGPTATPTAPTLSSATASPSFVAPSPTVVATPLISSPSVAATTPAGTATPSPRAGGGDVAAATCTGSADTKDFFTAIAEAVGWPVYCAVLPAGWSVEAGSYRLADGGQMVIAYKTRTGGHLELREGRWCTASASACSPHDTIVGPARFGDLNGQLETLGDDLLIYVNPGQAASWTATGRGLDEATFRSLCARLGLVKA